MTNEEILNQFQNQITHTQYRDGSEAPGYIKIIDVMGDEKRIADAARTSYAKGTKRTSTDEGLLRYLFVNRHTSPFEMVQITMEVACPIFIARQWLRHRTWSVNEQSLRYSEAPRVYHRDPVWATQSVSNKQGSGTALEEDVSRMLDALYAEHIEAGYSVYDSMLQLDVAREQARMALSVAEYTVFVGSVNLHNLLHWMTLRIDNHAQFEIRQFAQIVEEFIKTAFPTVYQAWVDCYRDQVNLRGDEIRHLVNPSNSTLTRRETLALESKILKLQNQGLVIRKLE